MIRLVDANAKRAIGSQVNSAETDSTPASGASRHVGTREAPAQEKYAPRADAPFQSAARLVIGGVHLAVLMGIVALLVSYGMSAMRSTRQLAVVKVVAPDMHTVAAPCSGQFRAVRPFSKGERVHAGQVLGVVQTRELQDRLRAARHRLLDLQRELLLATQAVRTSTSAARDEQQFRQLRLDAGAIQNEIARLAALEQDRIVRSPIDGRIWFGLSAGKEVTQHEEVTQIWPLGGEVRIEIEAPLKYIDAILREGAVQCCFTTPGGEKVATATPVPATRQMLLTENDENLSNRQVFGRIECLPDATASQQLLPGWIGRLGGSGFTGPQKNVVPEPVAHWAPAVDDPVGGADLDRTAHIFDGPAAVAPPAVRTPSSDETFVAVVVPDRFAGVQATAAGTLREVLIGANELVEQGAPLAVLDSRAAEASLRQRRQQTLLCQSKLREAHCEYGNILAKLERRGPLVKTGVISSEEYRDLQGKLQMAAERVRQCEAEARASLEEEQKLQDLLDRYVITAPFCGKVKRVIRHAGQYVREGDVILEVESRRKRVHALVPTALTAKVRKASLHVEDADGGCVAVVFTKMLGASTLSGYQDVLFDVHDSDQLITDQALAVVLGRETQAPASNRELPPSLALVELPSPNEPGWGE